MRAPSVFRVWIVEEFPLICHEHPAEPPHEAIATSAEEAAVMIADRVDPKGKRTFRVLVHNDDLYWRFELSPAKHSARSLGLGHQRLSWAEEEEDDPPYPPGLFPDSDD